MLFSEIIKVTNAQFSGTDSSEDISVLAFDTRKLGSGKSVMFLALSGPNRDGHAFIKQAYEKGVRHFLVSSLPNMKDYADAQMALVTDVLEALQQIVIAHRSHYNIPVLGITGSNGKTMIKEWLAEVVGEKFNVVKSPKSYNSQIGVPLSVWDLSAQHDLGIFEAGISEPGDMSKLRAVIQPTIGLFTNIGNAHDEGFESLDQKIREKAQLFVECKKVICCRDQEQLFPTLKSIFEDRLLSWSAESENADISFRLANGELGCSYLGQDYHFKISASDVHHVENLLHVIAVSLYLGLNEEDIKTGLKRIKPVSMRLELKRGSRDCYIVDDTYNNDLAGLSIALEYLKQQPHKKRKTVILSDIQQSGLEDSELYARVNELLVANEINRLIGVGKSISGSKESFTVSAAFFETVTDLIQNFPPFENELILVKGARSFAMEKVVSLLEEKSHGTSLEVNFEALTHNLNVYRSRLSGQTKMMVMVKAFAYGGGLGEIAHLLQYEKVDYLGVAYTDEGVELRQRGITLPIMVMNADWQHFDMLEAFDLQPEIYSAEMLRKYLGACDTPPPIHIKIETGMNRLGFRPQELEELIEILKSNEQLHVAGIFTHFSSSEEKEQDDYTIWQAEQLDEAFERIIESLSYVPMKYALNSAGIVRWPQYHFDMVRLGIGLYGYDSSEELKNLKPVSILKSQISQIRSIKKGESIGYSRKGTMEKDGQIGVVSIGYADGYLRTFGRGKAYMMVNGKQAPTIGNICMDMTILDVTGLDVKEGDEVVVFGENPSIEHLAEWADTIPYEILTNVSQRVKRVFVSE